jgi:hypothetical protein
MDQLKSRLDGAVVLKKPSGKLVLDIRLREQRFSAAVVKGDLVPLAFLRGSPSKSTQGLEIVVRHRTVRRVI